MELTETPPKRHVGKNIEKLRTYFGIKQSALGADIGFSQSEISNIEHQEEIEDSLLSKIAIALGVTPEMIKNFDVERAMYQINHVRENNFASGSSAVTQHINPIEKIVELYERLLKSEREKIDILKALKKDND